MFSEETLKMIQQDLGFDETEIKANTREIVWGYIHELQNKLTISLEIDKMKEKFKAQIVSQDKTGKFGLSNYHLRYASPVVGGDAKQGVTYISRNIRMRLIKKIIDTHREEIKRLTMREANRELAVIFCQEIAKEMGLRETKTGDFAVSSLSTLSAHSTGVRLELKEYITINPENIEKINQLKKLISAIKQVKNDS